MLKFVEFDDLSREEVGNDVFFLGFVLCLERIDIGIKPAALRASMA